MLPFRLRCFLCVAAGVALALKAYSIAPCSLGSGPCDSAGRAVAFVAFLFVVFGGIGPLFNRWMWKVTKMADNHYQLEKWQDRCDGPSGPAIMWFSGINRDGSLRP